MSTVLSWAAAVWRRVFCGQKSEHVLVAKESRDADEADIIHGGISSQVDDEMEASTPPPQQRCQAGQTSDDAQGSKTSSPPVDLKPFMLSALDTSAATPLLQPRKGVAFVVGAGSLRTPLGEQATNRYILEGAKVVGMANTVQKYAPHQAVVQHGTPFNERVDREVMRQLRVGE